MRGLTVPALCVGFFAASIGLAHLRPFGNPRNITEQQRIALTGDAQMRDAAKRVLIEKCADCHSDATRWPFYSNIAPVSWLIEHDVVEGREHLNLSRWRELSPDRALARSATGVESGNCPAGQARHYAATPIPANSLARPPHFGRRLCAYHSRARRSYRNRPGRTGRSGSRARSI